MDTNPARHQHNHSSRSGCHRCGFIPKEWPNLEGEQGASHGGRPKGKRQTEEEKNAKRRIKREIRKRMVSCTGLMIWS